MCYVFDINMLGCAVCVMAKRHGMEIHNIGISYTLYLTILSNWPVYLQFNTFLNGTLQAVRY